MNYVSFHHSLCFLSTALTVTLTSRTFDCVHYTNQLLLLRPLAGAKYCNQFVCLSVTL